MDIQKVKEDIKNLTKFKINKIATYFDMKESDEEAKKLVEEVSYRGDVPVGEWIPKDLQDVEGSWIKTKSGYPVAGYVLPHEVHIGSPSPMLPAYLAIVWTIFYASVLFAKSGTAGTSFILFLVSLYAGFTKLPVGVAFKNLACMIGIYLFLGALGIFSSANEMSLSYVALSVIPKDILSVLKTLIMMLPIFVPFLSWRDFNNDRNLTLITKSSQYAGAVISAPKTVPSEARFNQALNAKKAEEKGAKFIPFGVAEGVTSSMGDEFAPDANQAMGVDMEDLKATHIIAVGSTGEGKTTGFLRKCISAVLNSPYGMWLSDGKNSLGNEIVSDKLINISPETVKHFNPLANLDVNQKAAAFREAMTPRDSRNQNGKFDDKAEIALTDVFIFQEELVKVGAVKNSLEGMTQVYQLYIEKMPRIINDETGDKSQDLINHPLINLMMQHDLTAKRLSGEAEDEDGSVKVLTDALNRFRAFHDMDAKEKGLITFSLEGWISPLSQNKLIRDWYMSETSDFDLKVLTEGAKAALTMPKELELVGVLLNKLIQNQVVNLLYKRGEDWKNKQGQQHLFIITDEFQDVYDKNASKAMSVIRGFGGTYICATQNIESVVTAMGEEYALRFLDGFKSFVVFKTSHKSTQFFANKLGSQRIWLPKTETSIISLSQTATTNLANVAFDINSHLGRSARNTVEKELFNSNGASFSVAGHSVAKIIGRFIGNDNNQKTQEKQKSALDLVHLKTSLMTLSEKPIPLFNDDVIAKLSQPHTCFAQFIRGGSPRRDVMKTNPLASDFSSIKDKVAKENEELMEKYGIKKFV